jgi:hypothetical protein
MPLNTFFIQKRCDRCGHELTKMRRMSFFNKETLCENCSTKEDEIRRTIREQEGDQIADLKYQGIGVLPVIKHQDRDLYAHGREERENGDRQFIGSVGRVTNQTRDAK